MRIIIAVFSILLISCTQNQTKESPDLYVTILGIAQDAGSPQIGCKKDCCIDLWKDPTKRQKVVSLGIVDKKSNKVWMFDATPDFKDQLDILVNHLPESKSASLEGIFLTHAHMGHYTGLMDLGREAMSASKVPVYAMPRMADYLSSNGPWSQLVTLNNIDIRKLKEDSTIILTDNLRVTPILVPHRDEYSETVGYKVESSSKSFLFVPDIDKWHKWDRNIETEVENSSYAFLDGAFYSEDELPNRNMDEIPHPFVPETMEIFKDSKAKTREKIIFIHLNHTNKLLKNGPEVTKVESLGYKVGREGQLFTLQ